MPEGDNAIDVEKIVKEITDKISQNVNSQVEKIATEIIEKKVTVMVDSVNKHGDDIQKLAEAGNAMSKTVSTLVDTVNTIGKKVEGIPRVSKADSDKAGSWFTTLLDDED